MRLVHKHDFQLAYVDVLSVISTRGGDREIDGGDFALPTLVWCGAPDAVMRPVLAVPALEERQGAEDILTGPDRIVEEMEGRLKREPETLNDGNGPLLADGAEAMLDAEVGDGLFQQARGELWSLIGDQVAWFAVSRNGAAKDGDGVFRAGLRIVACPGQQLARVHIDDGDEVLVSRVEGRGQRDIDHVDVPWPAGGYDSESLVDESSRLGLAGLGGGFEGASCKACSDLEQRCGEFAAEAVLSQALQQKYVGEGVGFGRLERDSEVLAPGHERGRLEEEPSGDGDIGEAPAHLVHDDDALLVGCAGVAAAPGHAGEASAKDALDVDREIALAFCLGDLVVEHAVGVILGPERIDFLLVAEDDDRGDGVDGVVQVGRQLGEPSTKCDVAGRRLGGRDIGRRHGWIGMRLRRGWWRAFSSEAADGSRGDSGSLTGERGADEFIAAEAVVSEEPYLGSRGIADALIGGIERANGLRTSFSFPLLPPAVGARRDVAATSGLRLRKRVGAFELEDHLTQSDGAVRQVDPSQSAVQEYAGLAVEALPLSLLDEVREMADETVRRIAEPVQSESVGEGERRGGLEEMASDRRVGRLGRWFVVGGAVRRRRLFARHNISRSAALWAAIETAA